MLSLCDGVKSQFFDLSEVIIMWNRDKSVLLSLVCTRILMVLGLVLAVLLLMPLFNDLLVRFGVSFNPGVLWVAPVYYVFCLPAYIALFSLDRLLVAIRRNEVFTARNIRYLRIISWCCFAVSLVCLSGLFFSGFLFLFLIVPAILAAFFGVILRVVKNLFAAAVALKDDNDFTI